MSNGASITYGTSEMKNFVSFSGRNIWRFMCMSLPGIPSSTVVTSQNPIYIRMKANLIANISSKGLTHIRRPVQKLQIFEQKNAFFPPCGGKKFTLQKSESTLQRSFCLSYMGYLIFTYQKK
jgi:hypothetical protein